MTPSKENAKLYRFTGLNAQEVANSRKKHGNNLFTARKRKSFFMKYLESFGDPIIKILMAALAVNVFLMFQTHNIFETVGIGIAVFLSTFVSTLSEYGSETAFLRLQREAEKLVCRVKRAGALGEIPIGEIVVGDIVYLEAGEKIPADGILIEGFLRVDESALNGESKETRKEAQGEEKRRILYRGTTVSEGEGIMLVQRVGDDTVYGRLAGELQTEAVDSPMKVRLTVLAKQISRIGYTAAVLIALADIFNALVIDNHYNSILILEECRNLPMMAQNLIHALLLAISVIVVAVPEGLPMMITVVLSSNMMRMQRAGVMVRKLVGIETAGSLNLLFTDKTGTLTCGNLKAERVITGNGECLGSFSELSKYTKYAYLVARASVCNGTAVISANGKAIGGNSTERALVSFAAPAYKSFANIGKEKTVPFDSAKKYAWTRLDDGTVLIKGAPEKLLPRCTGFYDKNGCYQKGVPGVLWEKLAEMTAGSMRVLLLAEADRDFDEREAKLTLIALVGIRDSLRPEAKASVETVRRAGIQTVMITGDNRETAVAIAKECGILTGKEEEIIWTGNELSDMDDREIASKLKFLRVVARALPTDKSRLVRIAQEQGLVVGMTGDGVNDATALKRADVGFAMGSGTEVAKEAGDIVILDNRFASITRAILYGRTIFHSIRKFLIFQLTMNFCAVCVSLIGPFIGVDTPVTVTQMLWINIIMDTLAGLAFAGEAPQKAYMEEMPKSRKEPIITGKMLGQILITGGYTVLLLSAFLMVPTFRDFYGFENDFVGFMTAFFTLFVFCGIFNAFNARTSRIRFLANIEKNKGFLLIMLAVSVVQILLIFFGGTMFRTHALSFAMIRDTVLLAFTVIPFDLMRKIFSRIFFMERN
ncbi:MAG: calcium-translocating P-type ATPase, PMCA-type [Clostridia bacterium]|nr:calcium-translocating P-type ATPase, PMCA-type [Clostridia bacterium]